MCERRHSPYSGWMGQTPSRVAMVSMHTSPAAQAGSGDAGGMNVMILATARELVSRGVEVELLTRATGQPSSRELEPGVTLFELPAGRPGPLTRDELSAAADEFGEAVATLTGRRSPRYDLLHAHYWLSGIAVLPVAIELGLPFVQSFHTLAAMKTREAGTTEGTRRAHSETYLSNQAHAVVASSAVEATSLIDDVRAPLERVWVVPPGVDVDLFRPTRQEAESVVRETLAIAPGRPILTSVGRVQPLKDQGLAIRTLAAVHGMHGWAPVLVIVGEPTPGSEDYSDSLLTLAAELGVDDEVRFVGALERQPLADLFAASTLTLSTSLSETFGLVGLESAASGTPVIGYRGSGLRESIAHGKSGLLVESRDPQQWAHAVCELLEDPPALSRLSASAREFALAHTWSASVSSLLGVYEQASAS